MEPREQRAFRIKSLTLLALQLAVATTIGLVLVFGNGGRWFDSIASERG